MKKLFVILGVAAVLLILAAVHAPAPKLALEATSAPRRVARSRPTLQPRLIVYVAGQVHHPGIISVRPGSRAIDAILQAGGITDQADPAGVNLAAPLRDGDEVVVPDARVAKHHQKTIRHAKATKRTRRSRLYQGLIVNLNRASAQQLQALPGIGAVLAERIVEFRQVNGPYASVDALLDVAGFSPARLDRVASYVRV